MRAKRGSAGCIYRRVAPTDLLKCAATWSRDIGVAHSFAYACLTLALTTTGARDEALAASKELPAAADATDNPEVASYTLLAYGIAQRDVAPSAAYDAHRRGLKIAQDT